jgi:hypothetical protein
MTGRSATAVIGVYLAALVTACVCDSTLACGGRFAPTHSSRFTDAFPKHRDSRANRRYCGLAEGQPDVRYVHAVDVKRAPPRTTNAAFGGEREQAIEIDVVG